MNLTSCNECWRCINFFTGTQYSFVVYPFGRWKYSHSIKIVKKAGLLCFGHMIDQQHDRCSNIQSNLIYKSHIQDGSSYVDSPLGITRRKLVSVTTSIIFWSWINIYAYFSKVACFGSPNLLLLQFSRSDIPTFWNQMISMHFGLPSEVKFLTDIYRITYEFWKTILLLYIIFRMWMKEWRFLVILGIV